MKTSLKKFITYGVLTTISFSTTTILGTETHKTNLQTGKGMNLVLDNCTSCHSAAIIVQNRMSRSDWNKTITWMQEEQGLWELALDDRNKILDYLATHQGKTEKPTKTSKNAQNNKMYQYDYPPNPLYNF
tara:strand:+ start:4341 stop:4730 length:390 start_codon:yes stop_codon:yes gene_type:complete